MEQKRQSDNFVEDLYSQITKLSLEIAESKKVCGIFVESILHNRQFSFSFVTRIPVLLMAFSS